MNDLDLLFRLLVLDLVLRISDRLSCMVGWDRVSMEWLLRKHRWRLLLVGTLQSVWLVVIVLVVMLAGCGGSSEDPQPSATVMPVECIASSTGCA